MWYIYTPSSAQCYISYRNLSFCKSREFFLLKSPFFYVQCWEENKKVISYILFFIWATYNKASSRFLKASFNKSAHSISRSHFRCSLDENRNFSLLQNDNSTSLLPDLISADIFFFIVSIDSIRSFWKNEQIFIGKYSTSEVIQGRNCQMFYELIVLLISGWYEMFSLLM